MAGIASLFATYWDDAWHTDIGRDDALIPPHLLLYGAVAVAGLAVAVWGAAVVWRARSLAGVLRDPGLSTAATGGAVTLGAGVADAWWHEMFGRDSVLWSPPHILAVFGTVALIVGVLAGLGKNAPPGLRSVAGALLLGSALIAVLEFETDVPQFSESFYLPVLLISALFSMAVIQQLALGPWPMVRVVAIYVVVRLLIAGLLVVLGRSAPDVPLAVAGLVVADLRWRSKSLAYAAGAAGVSVTSVLSSVLGVASVPVVSVLPVALTVVAVFLVVLAAGSFRRAAAAIAVAAALVPMGSQDRAEAHDPGQGEIVAQAKLTGASDGHGTLTLAGILPVDCSAARTCRILARRAGETRTGAVTTSGGQVLGMVKVPPTGRWFTYLEVKVKQGMAETWLPLDAGVPQRTSQRRELYLPAGRAGGEGFGPAEVVSGVVLYAIGLAVLMLALVQTRRIGRSIA
ncbi:hypothetical protein [Nonomuraea sp. B19D2]|uniref:hypothetical protein n=1 Tax=Nonomuraea sp. B19D2 TaxID=3159561 RepID=UPI0032DA32BF